MQIILGTSLMSNGSIGVCYHLFDPIQNHLIKKLLFFLNGGHFSPCFNLLSVFNFF